MYPASNRNSLLREVTRIGVQGACSLMKVAIVVSHPIQHFCPLYRALAQNEQLNIRVFFGSRAGAEEYFDEDFGQKIQWEPDLLEGFAYEFLPEAKNHANADSSVSSGSLARRLSEFDPDVVQVYGLFHGISRTTMGWAKKMRKRVLYVSDSELLAPRGRVDRLKRRLILPWYFRRIDSFLTIGDSNEAFYQHYGVPSSRFYRCPHPINEEPIRQARIRSAHWRDEIRRRHQIPEGSPVALCVGKLIQRKSFDHAIIAIRELSATSPRQCPYLLIAGDGVEASVLRKLAGPEASYPVRFAGFVAADALPAYYAASDFLIHPAFEDHHPVAVSEAVASGLPVIASDHVGIIGLSDDVRIGLNGFQYPYGDVSALRSQIALLTSEPARRNEMSKASLAIAESRSMAHMVDAYLAAVKGVTSAWVKSSVNIQLTDE